MNVDKVLKSTCIRTAAHEFTPMGAGASNPPVLKQYSLEIRSTSKKAVAWPQRQFELGKQIRFVPNLMIAAHEYAPLEVPESRIDRLQSIGVV
jgi:hypothetical protein